MLNPSYNDTVVTRIRDAKYSVSASFMVLSQISPIQESRVHHVSQKLLLILRGEVECFSQSQFRREKLPLWRIR